MSEENKKYPVSAISRLRIGTDGGGVRTLIALSDCPLKCKYCINKFTWDGSVLPKMCTAEEVYKLVSKDMAYMAASNGGITFGGGEPLLHYGLVTEFRKLCNEGISIYVETAFNLPRKNIAMVISSVDKFIVDIKSVNNDIYEAYTGRDNGLVLGNIKWFIDSGYGDKLLVRVPIISGYADVTSQMASVKALKKLGVKEFDCFEYKV